MCKKDEKKKRKKMRKKQTNKTCMCEFIFKNVLEEKNLFFILAGVNCDIEIISIRLIYVMW